LRLKFLFDLHFIIFTHFMPSPAIRRRTHSVFGLSVCPSVFPSVITYWKFVLVGVSPHLQLRCGWRQRWTE